MANGSAYSLEKIQFEDPPEMESFLDFNESKDKPTMAADDDQLSKDVKIFLIS
jgi:hypothetical protein